MDLDIFKEQTDDSVGQIDHINLFTVYPIPVTLILLLDN